MQPGASLFPRVGLFAFAGSETTLVTPLHTPPLMPAYPGLPRVFVRQIHEAIKDHLHLDSPKLERALEPLFLEGYRQAEVDPSWLGSLARAAVTMEVQAITTIRQLAGYEAQEQRRRRHWHYRVRHEDDDQVTKMTRWIADQTPGSGLPLAEVEAVLDEAVRLAKEGAFTPRGSLCDIPGKPTVLPGWFRRRGYHTHWIDPRYPLFDVEDHAVLVRLV